METRSPSSLRGESQYLTDDYLYPNAFRLTIENRNAPNLALSVQRITLPSITINATYADAPQRRIPLAGDKIDYEPLSVDFIVNENLENYKEIHDWMVSLIQEGIDDNYKDLTLEIFSTTGRVKNYITFVDALPSNLGTLSFDTSVLEIPYISSQVTFDYSYFKIIDDQGNASPSID